MRSVDLGPRLCGLILVVAPFELAIPRDGFTPLFLRPVLLACAVLAMIVIATSDGPIDRALAIGATVLVGALTVASILSDDPWLGLAIGVRFAVYGLVAVAASRAIASQRDVRTVIVAAAVAGAVAAGVGLVVLWHGSDLLGTGSLLGSISRINGFQRLTRPFSHANVAAMFLGPVATLAVVRLAIGVDLQRARTHLAFVASLLCIALSATLSRGGNLSVVVTLGVVAGLLVRRRRIRSSLILAAFALFLMASIAVVPAWSPRNDLTTDVGQRVESGAGPKLQPLSRTEIWSQALDAFQQYPVFGVGPGQFGSFSVEATEAGVRPVRHAHNLVLELFATGGLFVGAALVAVLTIVGVRIRRAVRSDRLLPFGSALIVIGLHAIVDYPLAFASSGILIAVLVGAASCSAADTQPTIRRDGSTKNGGSTRH